MKYYAPESDRSIRYDDPESGVNWGIENPILSKKDLNHHYLRIVMQIYFKIHGYWRNGHLDRDVMNKLEEINFDIIAP
ncbi:MAG: dTDP-4-dehydrorhamnose 3,5-epimerase [Anaerocolumna sp.]|nr:dTDP-4-dehydrorhamnose 3,5-epimerase [Anaerocolumna sp.]